MFEKHSHVHVHLPPLDYGIAEAIRGVVREEMEKFREKFMVSIDQVLEAVAEQTTVIESARVAFQKLEEIVKSNATDQAKLQLLNNLLGQNKAALERAILEGTDELPAPEPEPEPAPEPLT